MTPTAGITIERTAGGKPLFARIDLRKRTDFIPILEATKGIEVKVEKPVEEAEEIKWTAQMKRSFAQAERGEWKVGDLNNFWDV